MVSDPDRGKGQEVNFGESVFFDGKIRPWTRKRDEEGQSSTYHIQIAGTEATYIARLLSRGLKHGMVWNSPQDFIRDAIHKYLLWCWYKWEPENADAAAYFQAVAGLLDEDFERNRRKEMDGVIDNLLSNLTRKLHAAQKERSIGVLNNIVKELGNVVKHIMLMLQYEPYYGSRWSMRLVTDDRILPIVAMMRNRQEFYSTPLMDKMEEWLALYRDGKREETESDPLLEAK